MADPFNEMRKLDQRHLDRDLDIMIRSFQSSGKIPDFDGLHRMFKKAALAEGKSQKGAQAAATLKILKLKEFLAHRD